MRRIVRESGVGPDDVVLEVGPGLGSLTLALLEVAARVVAIEIDVRLASLLPSTVAEMAPDQADRLEVVTADALRVSTLPGPPPTALVANLPYNVSVPVLLHLMVLLPSLERGLVMVQSEVAARLAAPPGSKVYGVPSAKAAWFADVRRAGTVGRHVFWPEPNVDSGLVAWERRDPPATRPPARRSSPSSTPRSPTGARASAVPCASWPARPRRPRPLWRRPVSSRSRGASRWASPTSPGSPRRWHEGGAGLTPEPQRSITVRAPAKVNLHLGVGARRTGRLPPARHRVPGGRALRRRAGQRRSRCRWWWSRRRTSGTWCCPTPTTTSSPTRRGCWPRLRRTRSGWPPSTCSSRSGSPWLAEWRAGPPTPPPTLVALDRLWALGTDDPELLLLAARLGSDVPFLLVGGTAHGTGRGDLLRPVPDLATWWWVVVPSLEGLSTPAVYERFDEMFPDAPETPASSAGVLMALASGVPERLAAALHNDLEAAALDLRPELGDLITRGEVEGALRGLVSGSGPTVLFLCDSADGARAVADALQAEDRGVVLVANGPVAGAHVLGPDVTSGA